MPTQHAYPAELAAYGKQRWPADASPSCPPLFILEDLLSTAYHASLLKEEERPVQCRLLLIDPEDLPVAGGPPTGLLRLVFDKPRPFTEHELRRLSPAAKYPRALIGIRQLPGRGLEIWGIVQSGPRWLRAAQGGGGEENPLPRVPTVRVVGPGRIALACGSQTLAELRGGRLTDVSMDVFTAQWIFDRFGAAREQLLQLHREAERNSGTTWAKLDPSVSRIVAQQVYRRLVATVRAAHHGGALLMLPRACFAGGAAENKVHLKYAFRDEEPRHRYRTLLLAVMQALAEHGDAQGGVVRWAAYKSSSATARLEEALLEISQLFAALADVDGAVVITPQLELLGFGAEITGDLPDVTVVHRALDLEGENREPEKVDSEGTRHRSAYRLCAHFQDALAIVVSQDGAVRFIAWHNGALTYWNHSSLESEL